MTSLFKIGQLAKKTPAAAEKLLRVFVREKLSQLNAVSIKINQSKVSLNSVNGFIAGASGEEYFFKFHTEEGEEESLKDDEYYNAEILAKAGLPVITPLFTLRDPGSQFVVYRKIRALTAFDLFEAEEKFYIKNGRYTAQLDGLLQAEEKLLERQFQTYRESLTNSPREEVERSTLNQLFFNRLVSRTSSPPRLALFYKGKTLTLPKGEEMHFSELVQLHWNINGTAYDENLDEIIGRAQQLLDPSQEAFVPTVIGHGDCHNGNKFFINNEFYFFDPAFAGRQPALLSFIKSTAHNVFLHPFWYYDPTALNELLLLNYEIKNGTIYITHNWNLAERSPMRLRILQLQIDRVWAPLIHLLREKKLLPREWQEYIRSALFCCPFLTLNLFDRNRFSAETSLLALSTCIELSNLTLV